MALTPPGPGTHVMVHVPAGHSVVVHGPGVGQGPDLGPGSPDTTPALAPKGDSIPSGPQNHPGMIHDPAVAGAKAAMDSALPVEGEDNVAKQAEQPKRTPKQSVKKSGDKPTKKK